jgi:hypothetical protein
LDAGWFEVFAPGLRSVAKPETATAANRSDSGDSGLKTDKDSGFRRAIVSALETMPFLYQAARFWPQSRHIQRTGVSQIAPISTISHNFSLLRYWQG